ncbi:MAG TPA: DUF1638 domain-containing protein [bacterium]|nr:DUF1638 domain-containing protein [bacterium]
MGSDRRITLIGCGILRKEFSLLPKSVKDRFKPRFLDSMLHLNPALLEQSLTSIKSAQTGEAVVFLYGDCCPRMEELSSGKGRTRTEGVNCIEIYLGRDTYRKLRREGTFFLMPEWAGRWKEIFQRELGFKTAESARDFMRDSMTQALYIDTGSEPVPEAKLAEFAEFTGLPVSIRKVETDHLREALEGACQKLEETVG